MTNSHRAAIGAQVGTVTGQDGAPAGTGIVAVTSGGPADRAGLRAGDVIQAAGGTPTPDTQALAGVLAAADPGDQLTLSVNRGGQDLDSEADPRPAAGELTTGDGPSGGGDRTARFRSRGSPRQRGGSRMNVPLMSL